MARKVKQLLLSPEGKLVLEEGYKTGKGHCYRQRCQMVLLKSDGYRSMDIGRIVGCCEMSVNNWVDRYISVGIGGLATKPGQGRKPILGIRHVDIVREAVQQERQRLSRAQEIIENNIGRTMSRETLTRFLKAITGVTNG